jgi:DNA polymerase-3 subunit delta'
MTTRMHHWRVYGHDWAVAHLQDSMAHERIRHGYLLVGAESVGKETLAREFAMALNCQHPETAPCGECSPCRRIASGNHPDVLYTQRESETSALKIEELRSMMQKLALKPFEARYRIAIFRDFDMAQPRAQDALLKTLEEPAPHAILILLAKSLEPVLATITSRSQIIHLRPAPIDTVYHALIDVFGADAEQARLLAHLSAGRMGWAISALHNGEILALRGQAFDLLHQLLAMNRVERFKQSDDLSKDKAALIPLLELWLSFWRDVFLIAEGTGLEPTNIDQIDALKRLAARLAAGEAAAALSATRQTISALTDTNANTRLALDVMLLDYPSA